MALGQDVDGRLLEQGDGLVVIDAAWAVRARGKSELDCELSVRRQRACRLRVIGSGPEEAFAKALG